jgi:uncharacterized protein YwqG
MQIKINHLVNNYINNYKKGNGPMTTMWYKLRDDTWGIKIKDGTGTAGTQVEVVNSKGKASTVTLNVRTAKFDDAELWSIQQ